MRIVRMESKRREEVGWFGGHVVKLLGGRWNTCPGRRDVSVNRATPHQSKHLGAYLLLLTKLWNEDESRTMAPIPSRETMNNSASASFV